MKSKEQRMAQRQFYLRKCDKIEELKEIDSVIGTSEEQGRFNLVIFKGTAGKPHTYCYFKTEERRASHICEYIENQKKVTEYKKQRAEERGSAKSSVAITAQAIREHLKREFPDVKFKVTSSNFSMGDSVSIAWTDGPVAKLVEEITDRYQHGYFDGMEDYYKYREIDKELNCSGSKYVMCNRHQSAQREEQVKQHYIERFGGEYMDDFNSWKYENSTPQTWEEKYRLRYEAAEQKRQNEALIRQAERQKEFEAQKATLKAIDDEIAIQYHSIPYIQDDFYISVAWSENSFFQSISDEKINVQTADLIFKFASLKYCEINESFKTGFKVFAKGNVLYEGRYCLGLEKNGLLQTIKDIFQSDFELAQEGEKEVKAKSNVIDFAQYKKQKQAQAF